MVRWTTVRWAVTGRNGALLRHSWGAAEQRWLLSEIRGLVLYPKGKGKGKGKVTMTMTMNRKADLRKLHPPGSYPNVEDKVALRLARAIHAAESTHCVTSWSAQERAEAFFNTQGLAATLDECERLEALRLPGATA